MENRLPRRTRGGQAARREGKRPLNPASSQEGRQAIAGAWQAVGWPGKQPEKLSKRPLNKRGGGGQASSLKTASSCIGKQLVRRQAAGKAPASSRKGTGKQPERAGGVGG